MSSESDTPRPILYSYFRSSCSWRVRIALALKGIEYELRPVNLLKREHKGDEFIQMNPQGFVPYFVHGHVRLSQSLAILEYIEEAFPSPVRLLPSAPDKRALVRSLAHIIALDIQPLQNLRVLQKVGDERKVEWARDFITEGFQALEKGLEKAHGRYCVGDVATLVDVCLAPQLYAARRFGVDMSKFPTICKMEEVYKTEEPFIRAAFDRQPDTPEDLRAT